MKNQAKKRLIYLRYILPPILFLLSLASGFIRSYKYVINGSINESISFFDLLNSSFSTSRETIFSASEQEAANLLFSQIIFSMIIVFLLLWLFAFAASLYSAYAAIKYFAGEDEAELEKSRTLFITIFPNRICLTLAQMLVLPLAIFPYALPMLYKGILATNVSLVYVAPDLLVFGTLAIIATAVLSVLCAKYERFFDADLFKKCTADTEDTGEDDSDYIPIYSGEKSAERNEEIRKMFSQDKDK